MDVNNMKNMVILKNLPSNMIEEAFVILKKDVKIHKLEVMENNKKTKTNIKGKNPDDIVIKEAELILQDYIDKIETNNSNKVKKNLKDISKKYERLKMLTIFLGMFSIISSVLILLK